MPISPQANEPKRALPILVKDRSRPEQQAIPAPIWHITFCVTRHGRDACEGILRATAPVLCGYMAIPTREMNRFRWYWARLRVMSAAEVLFRAKRAVLGFHAWSRELLPLILTLALAGLASRGAVPAGVQLERLSMSLRIPGPDTARIDLGGVLPECIDATLASARRICEGELSFFGRSWQCGPDWQMAKRSAEWTRVATRALDTRGLPSRWREICVGAKSPRTLDNTC